MSDRISYVLVYAGVPGEGSSPTFAGIWRGCYPLLDDEESFGLLVRQALAGFSDRATWRDLAAQLESAGFSRTTASIDEIMRTGNDIVRIIFWADGQIDCQWLTSGPDDNARAADKPIAILTPREGGN